MSILAHEIYDLFRLLYRKTMRFEFRHHVDNLEYKTIYLSK